MSHLPGAVRPTALGLCENESRVRVIAKDRCADDVVALVLAPGGGELPPWEAGAHVDLLAGDVAPRQYSLCGDPADRSTYRLGVLREAHGRGSSRFVHDVLTVGDEVVIRGPRNHFRLEDAPSYIFIAGGIGITAILPMVAAADRMGAQWRLAYGGRRRVSMAFLEELTGYGERVTVHPQDEVGLLDLDALLGAPTANTLVYCCGPEPLLAAVEDRCASGWPAGALHVERFSPKGIGAPADDGSFEIVLAMSGTSLTVPVGRSILETVRAAGIVVASSCQDGVCGTCETGLHEGEADHRDSVLSDEEKAENTSLMICVSRARSSRLVLDL